MERITATSSARNDAIRERCRTPGFGFLVLMCRPWGLGCTPYNVETYAEAKEIAERELAACSDYECALIRQKTYDPKMMITSSGPRADSGDAYDPYDADDL